jgi:hypothetical protein
MQRYNDKRKTGPSCRHCPKRPTCVRLCRPIAKFMGHNISPHSSPATSRFPPDRGHAFEIPPGAVPYHMAQDRHGKAGNFRCRRDYWRRKLTG